MNEKKITKIHAIADFHLSFGTNKPMDLFGGHWTGYEDRIRNEWATRIGPDDIGVIAGDLSWAMKVHEGEGDFEFIRSLPGTKIIIRGNHDYWWDGIKQVRDIFGPTVHALQNDAVKIDNVVFAGTRLWRVPERERPGSKPQSDQDKKLFDREAGRLELALRDAKSKMADGDTLIAVVHYPPFNSMRDDSPYTKLMEQYGVDICIYGHLHGKGGRKQLSYTKNGIRYLLTSCDVLDFTPMEIEI